MTQPALHGTPVVASHRPATADATTAARSAAETTPVPAVSPSAMLPATARIRESASGRATPAIERSRGRRLWRAVRALRRRPWAGHGLAVVLFAVALALRVGLGTNLPPGLPFLTFFPAVVAVAFAAGLGPGLLCGALSLIGGAYWLLQPQAGSRIDAQAALALAFFAVVCLITVASIEAMHRALDRLGEAQARTRDLLDERTLLFQELQHRVANNLASAAMRMTLLQRRLAAVPEAAEAVAAECRSFDALSRIHRALHDPADAHRPWTDTFGRLGQDYLRSQGSTRLRLVVDACEAVLPPDRSAALSLLVMEALTNALKHAFEAGQDGTVTVGLAHDAQPGWLLLRVCDDGCGLPATAREHEPAAPVGDSGLGRRIQEGLAAMLQGRIDWLSPPGGGTELRLRFPATRL